MSNEKDKILYMADCHVKARTWTNDAGIQRDAYEALTEVYSRVTGMGLDTRKMSLLIGGDLFDGNRPSSSDVLTVSDFLKLFRKTYLIPGNHDSVWPPFAESMFDADDLTGESGDRLLSIQEWDMEDMGAYTVGGVAWAASHDALMSSLTAYRDAMDSGKRHYVMIHAGVRELLGYDGTWQVSCDELHDMFRGLNVMLLVGHVHTRRTMDLGDGVVLHSPGSLYPCSWDEALTQHSVTIIDAVTGELTDVPVTVRKYTDITWRGNMDDIRNAVESLSGVRMPLPPVVRIRYSGESPGVSMLPMSDSVIYRLVDDSVSVESVQANAASSLSLLDAVREELDDADLADMAVALCESDDPVAEIERWLTEWKVERIV